MQNALRLVCQPRRETGYGARQAWDGAAYAASMCAQTIGATAPDDPRVMRAAITAYLNLRGLDAEAEELANAE